MYIDIFILVLLIGSILGLSVAIVFIVTLYSRLIKKIEETEKEKILLHSNIIKKAESLLSDAHAHNLSIISDANRKAAEILSGAKQTSVSSDQALKQKLDQLAMLQEQTLQNLSADFLTTYKDSLEKMQSQDLSNLKKVSEEIEKTVEEQLTDFTQAVKKETVTVEQEVRDKVEAEYQKIEVDLQAYKKAELEKIQQSLLPLLKQVTQTVLGKALSIEDHEELVLKALEEAKMSLYQNGYIQNNNYQNKQEAQIPSTQNPA